MFGRKSAEQKEADVAKEEAEQAFEALAGNSELDKCLCWELDWSRPYWYGQSPMGWYVHCDTCRVSVRLGDRKEEAWTKLNNWKTSRASRKEE